MKLAFQFLRTLVMSEWCKLFHRKYHVRGTLYNQPIRICRRCDTD